MNTQLRFLPGAILMLIAVAFNMRGAETTFVSPYYFGPNAFQVPEPVDSTSSRVIVEAGVDHFSGFRGDCTLDATLKCVIPLFTPRANLCVWLPVMEWYRHSDEYLEACGVAPPYDGIKRRGGGTGDVYVTTDILVLQESRVVPDVVLRAALKTASGGGAKEARYYDCPGYFFDLTAAKTFPLTPELRLRTAVSSGFLCWQTDKSRQNDAVQFAGKLALTWRKATLAATFAGYSGWEHAASSRKELARDLPMVVRTRVEWRPNSRWTFSALYERGLKDYPYNRFQITSAFAFPIFR